MFGLTTALKLKEKGVNVAVIEAFRVGMGVGGFSTAKLCSLQRTMFTQIRSKFDDDVVRAYGTMNQEGMSVLLQSCCSTYDCS
jgi:2-polyprenyl-6-methoxyphenol hydroxylase-like FAD-dependent oxidoreductase